jgi:hypothetical protein
MALNHPSVAGSRFSFIAAANGASTAAGVLGVRHAGPPNRIQVIIAPGAAAYAWPADAILFGPRTDRPNLAFEMGWCCASHRLMTAGQS